MRPAPPGRRETAHAGLLHNMSCRPSTQIRHVAAQQRAYGHKRVFQLPKDSGEVRPASGWLKELHCRYRKVRPQLAEAELRRLINEHVITLRLPRAAAVPMVTSIDMADINPQRRGNHSIRISWLQGTSVCP